MNMNEIKEIVELRNMVYKGNFLESLTKDEFMAGIRKVNLQPVDNLDSLNGEECWVWLSENDRKYYDNNSDDKTIKAILANHSIEYMNILFWGSEITIKCNGINRPTLSKDWIKEKILSAYWFKG